MQVGKTKNFSVAENLFASEYKKPKGKPGCLKGSKNKKTLEWEAKLRAHGNEPNAVQMDPLEGTASHTEMISYESTQVGSNLSSEMLHPVESQEETLS